MKDEKTQNTPVLIVMGSDSDMDVLMETAKMLRQFGVGYDITVSSAHRSPDRTRQLIREKEQQGIKIFIVGAGRAAHLAGVIAAETVHPVIGIPIESRPFQGVDSLLSTVQMPGGVPVATMATGKTGAKNAALFAVQILALSDARLQKELTAYKQELERAVGEKAAEIEKHSWRPE